MAYNLLKGKRGIIFGALNELSIAWKVAERAHEEGAQLLLTNTPVSIRLGTISKLAEKCGAVVIPADATSVEDLENLVDKAVELLVVFCLIIFPPIIKARFFFISILISIFYIYPFFYFDNLKNHCNNYTATESLCQ